MKWKNKWLNIAFFFGGFLACYISLQFTYFDIKTEIDLPSLILNILALLVGLYIAETLQKRVNQNQIQYEYLINKLDCLWKEFNDFSEKLSYDDKIEVLAIQDFNKEVIYPISFLKNIFNSFSTEDECVCNLENKLESFETFLSELPANNNIADYTQHKEIIKQNIIEINRCFSVILKSIQDL